MSSPDTGGLRRRIPRTGKLPTGYQQQKRKTLQDYLALLTTTNGAAWNNQWGDFAAKMGVEFAPLYANVIEAQKVAEAYEAGYANPDDFLEEQIWHNWDDKDASEFGRLALDHFCKKFEKEGFIGTRHVSVPEVNPLYRFTMFSRHRLGEDFWLKILKTE